MYDIILFRPPESYSNNLKSWRPPLNLIYLATPLSEAGYSVKIIDSGTDENWRLTFEQSLSDSLLAVGISVMTGIQIKGTLEAAKLIKNIKNIPIILGGIHPTMLPLETIKNKYVDIIVKGEGEIKLLNIVKNLKENRDLSLVKGIIYKSNDKIIETEMQNEYIDLNKMNIPKYDFVDIDYYKTAARHYFPEKINVIDLNTDRGCPYRCGFCYNLNFNNRKWRYINEDRLIDIIVTVKNKYDIKGFNFVSDNFFVNQDRVKKFCSSLIEKKIDILWHADIRIDTFVKYDEAIIKLIYESGCRALTFGIESGSQKTLNLIHKDIKIEDILIAHKRAKKNSFKTFYHFMVGFPDETIQDIRETIKLIDKLKQDEDVYIYGPSTYVPYPGTTLYNRCKELDLKVLENFEDWISYDWAKESNLPWFNDKIRIFIEETQNVIQSIGNPNKKRSLLKKLFYWYMCIRLKGLIFNIKFNNIDFNIIQRIKKYGS